MPEMTPAERGRKAAQLRVNDSRKWSDIADELGYSSPAGAFTAARRHAADAGVELPVKEYRQRGTA